MKKVFWTTVFWAVVIAGGLSYLKWFDQDTAKNIVSYIVDLEATS